MAMVEVPDELLEALARSKLGGRDPAKRVRVAVAIELHQAEDATISETAYLAGMAYGDFWDLLVELGLPVVRYGQPEIDEDTRAIEAWKREHAGQRRR